MVVPTRPFQENSTRVVFPSRTRLLGERHRGLGKRPRSALKILGRDRYTPLVCIVGSQKLELGSFVGANDVSHQQTNRYWIVLSIRERENLPTAEDLESPSDGTRKLLRLWLDYSTRSPCHFHLMGWSGWYITDSIKIAEIDVLLGTELLHYLQ